MRKIDLYSAFTMLPAGHGHFKVTYTNPIRGDYYVYTTSNMPLIDAVHHNPDAKLRDLETLKNEVKRNGYHYNKKGVRIFNP